MISGFVDIDWLAEHQEDAVIIDVRDTGPFRRIGHIPTAVNIPYEEVRNPSGSLAGHLPDKDTFETIFSESGISPDDTVVAYDDAPGVYAARVLLTAQAFGHDGELYVLDGGFEAWSEKYDLESGEQTAARSDYTASEPGDPIVDRNAVENAVNDDDQILVDTRSRAEYESASIPGAVQVSWEDFIQDGQLCERSEIFSLLADRGITKDKKITLYCNTARRLSHTYSVLAELGYTDISVYEGSLTDWIREQDRGWSPLGLKEEVQSHRSFTGFVDDLGEDAIGRLKLVGMYHQKHRGYFMFRTKVPGGKLTAEQAKVIGEVADKYARAPEEHGGKAQNPEFGDGYLDITTRQGIQMHWVQMKDVPEIWDRYDDVGLTTLQSGGNSVRNVVTCPVSGLTSEESVDVHPTATDISDYFLGDERYANLPRKLKVSITGCHENCARGQIHDLTFLPAEKGAKFGFNVHIGGRLSDGPMKARNLDLFVQEEQIRDVVEATADMFIDHGSYLDTAVNRLGVLVDEWGIDEVRSEIVARCDFEINSSGDGLTEQYRGDHVGIHEQEDGNQYIGLNVPVGRMSGTDLTEIADIAAKYGNGEIRLSPAQNLIIPGVEPEKVDEVRQEPVIKKYSPDPGPFERGVIACTGKEYCTYGIINTKNRAARWARELDEWYEEEYEGEVNLDAVRAHLSGCSASCAHPQLADFGMRGEEIPTVNGSKPAVDLGLGGDLGRNQFVDWVAGSVPTADVPEIIKRMLTEYGKVSTGQSFSEWVEETSYQQLQQLVSGDDQPAPTMGKTKGGN